MSLSRPTILSEHADRNERALAPGRTGLPLCRLSGTLAPATALSRIQKQPRTSGKLAPLGKQDQRAQRGLPRSSPDARLVPYDRNAQCTRAGRLARVPPCQRKRSPGEPDGCVRDHARGSVVDGARRLQLGVRLDPELAPACSRPVAT